jgi:serine/threonine-protein kinase
VEGLAKSRAAAARALSLDPNLAEAHTAVGVLAALGEWDWERAEESFERAIELDPSDTWAYQTYGLHLQVQGRFDEAIVQLEHARRIDPIYGALVTEIDLGNVYALRGDLEGAARVWQERLELAPEDHGTHRRIGNHLCQTGSFEQGLEELERALSQIPDSERVMADLGYCHARAGNAEEAREYLRRIEASAESRYVDPVHRALVHLGLRETERAIELLGRAYELHSPLISMVPTDPRYAPIRADPRFAELIRGMGLYGLLPSRKG